MKPLLNLLIGLLAPLALAIAAPAPGTAASGAPGGPVEVMVFGGTGQLGAEIVRRLVARGDQVTVFTRPGSYR